MALAYANAWVFREQEETTMRKLFLSIGAILIAATAIFVWSHTTLRPLQASQISTINPSEIAANYKGELPVERWDD
jgi:hypothetical protein